MSKVKIAIAGINGRMGRFLAQTVANDEQAELVAATEFAGSSVIGCDVGELCGFGKIGVEVVDSIEKVAQFDVLIDFTRPEPSLVNIKECVNRKAALVLGTTGFSDDQKAVIAEAAKSIPLVFAANYSVGVNLLCKLLETATKIMGDYADIEVIEAHHRHKVDAPSGTALALGEVVANTMGKNLNDIAVKERNGIIGEREAGTIGFSTIRAADIVGEHTVMFADTGERIELTHKASSRQTFATGAVRAAKWLVVNSKEAKLYSMQDVLGFNC